MTSLLETYEEDIREMEVVSEGDLGEEDPMPVYEMVGDGIAQRW
jgi:hypothetical protein